VGNGTFPKQGGQFMGKGIGRATIGNRGSGTRKGLVQMPRSRGGEKRAHFDPGTSKIKLRGNERGNKRFRSSTESWQEQKKNEPIPRLGGRPLGYIISF